MRVFISTVKSLIKDYFVVGFSYDTRIPSINLFLGLWTLVISFKKKEKQC